MKFSTLIKHNNGLSMPRVIRSTSSCLTCRRRGVRCDWELGRCFTCKAEGYYCVQPISTVFDPTVSASPAAEGQASGIRIMPDSALAIQLNAGPGRSTGLGQGRDLVIPNEPSDIMPRLTQQIIRSQEIRLSQTPGCIPDPAGGEQDHDYAAYYDHAYEEHLMELLYDSDSEANSLWPEENAPPLADRLRIFFEHAQRHLLPSALCQMPVSLLPANEYSTAEILFYYNVRQPGFRSNNSIDIDLNDDKFRQLAYSNPLVMQLIVAHKADHRPVNDAAFASGEGVERFHAAAIRKLGPKIARYLAGNEDEMLSLTLGSVVLSLTEMARLNKYGQSLNYAPSAKSLLTSLAALSHNEIANSLPDILVEYVMHTVSFACVSTDAAKAESIPFMSEMLRTKVNDMIALGYKGNLCGIWIEVLYYIQRIFQLGMSIRGHPSGCITPNDVVNFGVIQSALMDFSNTRNFENRGSPLEVAAAGLFKNAAVLYLWSLLDEPPNTLQTQAGGIYPNGISNMVMLSLQALKNDIPERDPINKTLIWPLLILGCFATTPHQKSAIQDRLLAISEEFTVGNPRETLCLLTNVWKAPKDQRNPWLLWKHIRSNLHMCCNCTQCVPAL
ncbi:c6 transcription factor [Trichoderma arundinaceum]|uniref:C6 transcription factor n=1 Tax=Trichoderma arundinaceum TaxID=490622 RepID=A0A395N9H5_TRIAR|nr:c6 transcription factor [Trichoderma arundinaceum]